MPPLATANANVAYSYVHPSWWCKLRRPRRGERGDAARYHARPSTARAAPGAAVDAAAPCTPVVHRRATYAYNRAPFSTEPGQGLSVGMYALLGKLQPFFEREDNAATLLRLVHKRAARHEGSVHMRNFAWFCMHYAQDKPTHALITVRGKAMYPPSVLAALHRSFTRESMDAHCREDRRTGRCGAVLFRWRGVVVRTTVAQLNYVHWMIVTGVYASLLRCRQEVAAHAKRAPTPTQRGAAASANHDAVLFVETGPAAALRLRGHARAQWLTSPVPFTPQQPTAWAPVPRPRSATCSKVS
uniref:Uncharacterized protein n=1 Tax=viral metagenome TaxID=1070528 RepID=A0A6C0AU10_9ZZZZ